MHCGCGRRSCGCARGCECSKTRGEMIIKFVVSVLLFIALAPGLLFTLPPGGRGLNIAAIVIHGLLFGLLYRILMAFYYKLKHRAQKKKYVRFAHDMEQHIQTAALMDLYNMQADQGEAIRQIGRSCNRQPVVVQMAAGPKK